MGDQQAIKILDEFISELKEIMTSIPGRQPLEYRDMYEDGYDQGSYTTAGLILDMIERKRKSLISRSM